MTSKLLHLLLWFATFPYHWTLRHFTVLPIQRIVDKHKDGEGLQKVAIQFLRGKLEELTLVKIGVCFDYRNFEKLGEYNISYHRVRSALLQTLAFSHGRLLRTLLGWHGHVGTLV